MKEIITREISDNKEIFKYLVRANILAAAKDLQKKNKEFERILRKLA